jgi:hypothetical protein
VFGGRDGDGAVIAEGAAADGCAGGGALTS